MAIWQCSAQWCGVKIESGRLYLAPVSLAVRVSCSCRVLSQSIKYQMASISHTHTHIHILTYFVTVKVSNLSPNCDHTDQGDSKMELEDTQPASQPASELACHLRVPDTSRM